MLQSHRASSRRSKKRRGPLQELAISPAGNLARPRKATLRPFPSVDKENFHAVLRATRSNQDYIVSQLRGLGRLVDAFQRNYSTSLNDEALQLGLAIYSRTMADHPAAMPHTRLSMPEMSDDSGSEPDLSVLGMTRARPMDLPRPMETENHSIHDRMEAEDTSVEDDDLEDDDDHHDVEDVEDVDAEVAEVDPAQHAEALLDPASLGLKEISNLGRFTVSSHKQGNGVEELRSDDLNLFWQ